MRNENWACPSINLLKANTVMVNSTQLILHPANGRSFYTCAQRASLQTGIMNLITIAWVNTDNEFPLLILICCPAAAAAPSMSMWLCVGCWHCNVNVLCPV